MELTHAAFHQAVGGCRWPARGRVARRRGLAWTGVAGEAGEGGEQHLPGTGVGRRALARPGGM